MTMGVVVVLVYIAVLALVPESRTSVRLLVTRTPWRTIASGMFEAFPTSRWRGPARLIGVPFAWYFATVVVTLFAFALATIEIVFSPRLIYCGLARWSKPCRWPFTPPDHTPPRAVAMAMPKPERPVIVDAVSRIRLSR